MTVPVPGDGGFPAYLSCGRRAWRRADVWHSVSTLVGAPAPSFQHTGCRGPAHRPPLAAHAPAFLT